MSNKHATRHKLTCLVSIRNYGLFYFAKIKSTTECGARATYVLLSLHYNHNYRTDISEIDAANLVPIRLE